MVEMTSSNRNRALVRWGWRDVVKGVACVALAVVVVGVCVAANPACLLLAIR